MNGFALNSGCGMPRWSYRDMSFVPELKSSNDDLIYGSINTLRAYFRTRFY